MIKARTRRIIQGSDYSAQEPRLLSQLCMDEGMLKAYRDGKDLYVEIASISFHIPYKYCLEHFPKGAPIKLVDGKWEYAKLKNGQDDDIQNFEDLGKYLEPNFNPDLYDYDKLADGEKDSYKKGKAYRGQAKKILLGIMYGRGKKSIAEQLGCSIEEAEQIKNNVYEAFPRIKVFEEESTELVKQKGYVTTLWGRKRRLPEYNLPPYSIYYLIEKEQIKKNKKTVTQVPDTKNKVPQAICEELYRKLNSLRGWDARNEFIDKKKKDGILIVDNHSAIAQASRQIINSRVQGCLDGNTRIQTKEYGIVKLKDFVGQTLTLWDGNDWTSGTIVPSGKKKKCVIHFIGGQEFICSPTHKFDEIGTDGKHRWRECKDLKKGMHLNINQNYVKSDYSYISDRTNNKTRVTNGKDIYFDMVQNKFELGRILGRLASDGSFCSRIGGSSNIRWLFAEHEYSIIDEVTTYLSELGYYNLKYDNLRPNKNQKMAQINKYSKTLITELETLDIKHKVHDNIFMDTEMLRGFISGMFDGDGEAHPHGISLCFGKQFDFIPMMQDIQKALLFYGICSYINVYKGCYRLRIKQTSAKQFATLIGFMNKKKQTIAEQIVPIKDCHVFGPSIRIESIEFFDEEIEMFDVCNTDRGYFIADGIVTHNSAADMSKLALIKIHEDEELIKRGVKEIIPVHDEILIETPLRYARFVEKRFSHDMEVAAKPALTIPIYCDVENATGWARDQMDLEEELKNLPII